MWLTTLFFIFEGLLCFFLSNIFAVYSSPNDVAWSVVMLTSIVFIFNLASRSKDNQLNVLIVLGYCFRILLMICDLYWITLPGSGGDTKLFQTFALNYLFSGDAGAGGIYSSFLGGIYYFYGTSEIIGRYINILLSVYVIFILIKVLKKLNSDNRVIMIAVA